MPSVPIGRPPGVSGRQAQPRARRPGFTVVELMVTILIAGLALAATLPAFRTSLTGHRLNTAAEELQAKLRLTRARAIAEDTPYIAGWNPDDGALYLVRDEDLDGEPDWGTEPGEGPFCIPAGITFTNDPGNPFPDEWVVFNPDGSTNASGSVILTNEKGQRMYVDVLQPGGVINVLTEKSHDAGE